MTMLPAKWTNLSRQEALNRIRQHFANDPLLIKPIRLDELEGRLTIELANEPPKGYTSKIVTLLRKNGMPVKWYYHPPEKPFILPNGKLKSKFPILQVTTSVSSTCKIVIEFDYAD